MILSMGEQASTFLVTVIAGFIIGFLFDIFRIIRKIIPHSGILTQMEDIAFWIIVSLGMFYIMLNQNYGEIRAFNILGTFIGAVLYFQTLSRLIVAVSEAIINFIKKMVRTIIKFICMPFKWFYKILKIPIKAFSKFVNKRIFSFKKLLRKWRNYGKIKAKGFLREFKVILKKS